MDNSNNNQIKRGKRGRPKIVKIKPEYSECTLCWHVYDKNKILTEQRLIGDTNCCNNCFSEILNPKENYNDDVHRFWLEGKIRYGRI